MQEKKRKVVSKPKTRRVALIIIFIILVLNTIYGLLYNQSFRDEKVWLISVPISVAVLFAYFKESVYWILDEKGISYNRFGKSFREIEWKHVSKIAKKGIFSPITLFDMEDYPFEDLPSEVDIEDVETYSHMAVEIN